MVSLAFDLERETSLLSLFFYGNGFIPSFGVTLNSSVHAQSSSIIYLLKFYFFIYIFMCMSVFPAYMFVSVEA